MERFKKLMLYAGVDRDKYLLVKDSIHAANRTSLIAYAGIVWVGMTVLLILSLFLPVLASSRSSYIFCILFSGVLLALALWPAKQHLHLVEAEVVLFMGFLLLFGIGLGTIVEPNQASASYAILMFAAPLLFTDTPLRTDLLVGGSMVLYFIAARLTQSPEMFAFNASIVLPYGGTSLILGAIVMRMRVERHVLIYENKFLSESDQLTGMLNRRCYEQRLSYLRQEGCPTGALFCAFDINGLKSVNDHLGHHAGDELICGAARCIASVFGPYGTCYRTGGDEFVAIIEGPAPQPEELQKGLADQAGCFHGSLVSGLSISVGIVQARPQDSVDELVQAADRSMYAFKRTYYQNSGQDRRKH